MNKMFFAAMLLVVGSASATTPPVNPGQSQHQNQGQAAGQKQSSSTVVDSSAVAGANNAGNSQNITFTSPETTTTTINQTVTGTTTNIVKQDQNVNQTINGKQEQVVSGGTNNTVHQTFGTQTIKNTPSVNGPPLTSSNDTCMGSASASGNGPGFGLSFGKTYVDENCKMLKNSRELWNMGMKGAAMALMCQDENNRRALEITGYECPTAANVRQRQATAAQYDATVKAAANVEPTDPYVRARMGLPKIKE